MIKSRVYFYSLPCLGLRSFSAGRVITGDVLQGPLARGIRRGHFLLRRGRGQTEPLRETNLGLFHEVSLVVGGQTESVAEVADLLRPVIPSFDRGEKERDKFSDLINPSNAGKWSGRG